LLSITGAGGYRIEIAEESMDLLEPNSRTDLTEAGIWKAVMDENYKGDQNRIIQRNGIPFHWPEFES
jgi:hypothetical protein